MALTVASERPWVVVRVLKHSAGEVSEVASRVADVSMRSV